MYNNTYRGSFNGSGSVSSYLRSRLKASAKAIAELYLLTNFAKPPTAYSVHSRGLLSCKEKKKFRIGSMQGVCFFSMPNEKSF